ncbi:hypothetical protein DSM106972_030760 [Dulcicalothrix desertica PCC 7102]|uniref:DUF2795 domain-containing protein n=1 Tax=Dulcicalothrix desertica PCC 7102 TaxID=232991 RepID=A0A433VL52_9CYAN|nr:DUF2795 domain-containing protein [Dulcicalothrix desertica]RUT06819.1 hypothetical protein DSM106972_030760 [Dulcicalothrix desertica PCC 7102]TWH50072.1 uncharacterized protein DUF2795 [Dulcicalothrix desertica PCC 7102]
MIKVNLVQIQKKLKEVNYPINKKDLIKHADEKGANEKILRFFKQLPLRDYQTATDVSEALNNLDS